jgi:hypothetical protein
MAEESVFTDTKGVEADRVALVHIFVPCNVQTKADGSSQYYIC